MNASLASLIYVCGIAGLFYLDRDDSVRTSKALWLPVIYLWMLGSRPLSVWLGAAPSFDSQVEGSPIDGAFFAILLIAALIVVAHRAQRKLNLLQASIPAPILIYFIFCLCSVCWSDYPVLAFKKWIKSVGDLAMILIVVTDAQPVAALRRLFSRIGFILLPMSVVFIKYYPNLGRTYEPWSGAQMVTGVTLDKNLLGVITFVLSLGTIWRVLALLGPEATAPDRRRHLVAQGALLSAGVWLLISANSATALACFILGAGLMLATKLRLIRRNPAAVHVLVVLLAIGASGVILFGGRATAAAALGRNATLTGRTDIWAAIVPMATNPLVGAGFESFWLNPNVHRRLWQLFPGLPLNEAHNGYIEMYLELGWLGVVLIWLILIDGYRRSVKAFRRIPALGGLLIAYVLSAMVYNVTEAGFRMLHPMWIFFLLAVVEATSIAAGVVKASQPLEASPDRIYGLPARSLEMRPAR